MLTLDDYPFTRKHKSIIEQWIQVEMGDEGMPEDGFDLHVDQICKRKGRHKEYWVTISTSLVSYANQYLMAINRIDVLGIVNIYLHTNENILMGFPNLEDVHKNLHDFIPPGLALFYAEGFVARLEEYTTMLGEIEIRGNTFFVRGYENFNEEDPENHIRLIKIVPKMGSSIAN